LWVATVAAVIVVAITVTVVIFVVAVDISFVVIIAVIVATIATVIVATIATVIVAIAVASCSRYTTITLSGRTCSRESVAKGSRATKRIIKSSNRKITIR